MCRNYTCLPDFAFMYHFVPFDALEYIFKVDEGGYTEDGNEISRFRTQLLISSMCATCLPPRLG